MGLADEARRRWRAWRRPPAAPPAAAAPVRRWLAAQVAGRREPPPEGEAARDLLARLRLLPLAAAAAPAGSELAGLRRAAVAADLAAQVLARQAVDLLARHGVECVTIKGPAFAAQAYGDTALRASADVDLLVRRRDLAAVRRACAAEGLRGAVRYPAWYEERWHDHAVFSGLQAAPQVPLEVHWDVVHAGLSRLPVDEVLAGRVAVACGAATLPAPSLPWQVVVTAAHVARHYFDGRSLVDLAFLARRLDEAAWAEAVACARRAALGPAVYYAVTLSSRWLEWEAPAAVAALRPGRLQDAVARRYLATLAPWPEAVTWRVIQWGKVGGAAAVSGRLGGLPGALRALSDRPNVWAAVDRALRRRGGRAVRRGRPGAA